jgi:hypothetical protein
VEFLLYCRVAPLPWLFCPGGRHHGRCIVVDPLDACSLELGAVLLRVVDVRCCAESAVGLLNSLRCGRRCTNSAFLLNAIHACFLKKKQPALVW